MHTCTGARPSALRNVLHNGQVDVAAGGIFYRADRDEYLDYSCATFAQNMAVIVGPLMPKGEVTMDMVCKHSCMHAYIHTRENSPWIWYVNIHAYMHTCIHAQG